MENGERAIRELMLATTRIDEVYYVFARRLGIKENTLALLYALDDGRPHSQTEISSSWLIPKTTINTSVHELMKEGYVTLLPESGSREKIVCLTDRGKDYARAVLTSVYEAERAAMDCSAGRYSTEFVEAIRYFADCLWDEMDKRTKERKRRE